MVGSKVGRVGSMVGSKGGSMVGNKVGSKGGSMVGNKVGSIVGSKRNVDKNGARKNRVGYMILQQDLDNLKKIANQMFKAIDNMKTTRLENVSPEPKIIDLSMLVGSDVLCQFSDKQSEFGEWYSKLESIDDCYNSIDRLTWAYCRVAYDIWQPHMTDEQPIPDGYMVETRDAIGIRPAVKSSKVYWGKINRSEASRIFYYYRVVGKADGYKHEWERTDEL